MTDIANNPARLQNVVPFSELPVTLQSGKVPNFVWISPNVINDMHGQPPGPGATVTYNDLPSWTRPETPSSGTRFR